MSNAAMCRGKGLHGRKIDHGDGDQRRLSAGERACDALRYQSVRVNAAFDWKYSGWEYARLEFKAF